MIAMNVFIVVTFHVVLIADIHLHRASVLIFASRAKWRAFGDPFRSGPNDIAASKAFAFDQPRALLLAQ